MPTSCTGYDSFHSFVQGDIFGGWVMSQMDLAGGIRAAEEARSRVVTVAVDAMVFVRPVKIGDVLCVYIESASVVPNDKPPPSPGAVVELTATQTKSFDSLLQELTRFERG